MDTEDQKTKRTVAGGNELLNPLMVLNQADIGYGMIVADLGCGGMAYFTLQAAKIVGDRGQVYAVDVVKTILPGIEHRAQLVGLSNIKTVWSNLEVYGATEIPQETVDLALLVNVLFQSPKRKEIVQEAERLVRKGGKLLVVDWKCIATPIGPPNDMRISSERVKEYATAAGFVQEKEFDAGTYHYGLLFRKA